VVATIHVALQAFTVVLPAWFVFGAIISATDEENKVAGLAKARFAVLTDTASPAHVLPIKETPMKMLAYLLAIICVIAAVMYYVMPAGQLPTFMPGYIAGSDHIHTTHAIAAAAAAVVLFVIGWFMGRR